MSAETLNKVRESEYGKQKESIPKIFELINNGSNIADIVKEAMDISGSGQDSRKCAFLFCQEMIRRGSEGVGALRYLIGREYVFKESLLKVVDAYNEGKKLSSEEIKEFLGIEQFGFVWDRDEELKQKKFQGVYEYLIEKKIFSGNFESFLQRLKKDISSAHLADRECLIEDLADFSNCQPSYIEAIGPEEVLRLRRLENPKMLLLGCFNKKGAQGFCSYSSKINMNASNYVIDIDDDSIERFCQEVPQVEVVKGTAKALPFKKGELDHVYTNMLMEAYISTEGPKSIVDMIKQASLVLKKGGKFVLLERVGGEVYPDALDLRVFKNISKNPVKYGFTSSQIKEGILKVLLSAELGNVKIDNYGFGDYRDLAIKKAADVVALVLTK